MMNSPKALHGSCAHHPKGCMILLSMLKGSIFKTFKTLRNRWKCSLHICVAHLFTYGKMIAKESSQAVWGCPCLDLCTLNIESIQQILTKIPRIIHGQCSLLHTTDLQAGCRQVSSHTYKVCLISFSICMSPFIQCLETSTNNLG